MLTHRPGAATVLGSIARVARRVLWVVKGLGPGGAERLLVEVAGAGLGSQVEVECAYVVPWKDHLAEELAQLGVVSHCVSRFRTDPRWPLRLARLIRHGGYDVVHVHAPLPGSVARLAVRSLDTERRPAVVTTEHNAWPTYHVLTRWLNRWTSRGDRATIAVSAETARSLRGRPARRVEVLRHGINVESVGQDRSHREAVRASLGVDPGTPLLVTVANYREQKDYPNLLAAARVLVDRGVDFRLLAVGQGPLHDEIVRRRDELGLQGAVDVCGFRPDARRLLAGADVFVLASQYEGLPVAAMEATALGIPIVSTRVGGMAEEWRDDVDAVLVPPGQPRALADAVERVVGDPALRRRLGRASRAKSAQFDVAPLMRRLAELYGTDRVTAATPVRRSTAGAAADVTIRPAVAEDRHEMLDVLWESMGGGPVDARHRALFAWKHDDNPFGASPALVAVDGQRIVGLRMMMRWEFRRGSEILRAVRAVDTATLPSHQGRGLFRRLTEQALADLRGSTDFVFNTPNAQSLPGYLSMGWNEVGRLSAAMAPMLGVGLSRVARARQPADLWSELTDLGLPAHEWLATNDPTTRWPATVGDGRQLTTNASAGYWRWRLGLADLHYRVVDGDDTAVVVRVRRRGPARELVVVAAFGSPRAVDRLARHSAKVARCDYAIRLGEPGRHGFIAVPGGGPVLTWRALDKAAMPPLANWRLAMADVELF